MNKIYLKTSRLNPLRTMSNSMVLTISFENKEELKKDNSVEIMIYDYDDEEVNRTTGEIVEEQDMDYRLKFNYGYVDYNLKLLAIYPTPKQDTKVDGTKPLNHMCDPFVHSPDHFIQTSRSVVFVILYSDLDILLKENITIIGYLEDDKLGISYDIKTKELLKSNYSETIFTDPVSNVQTGDPELVWNNPIQSIFSHSLTKSVINSQYGVTVSYPGWISPAESPAGVFRWTLKPDPTNNIDDE